MPITKTVKAAVEDYLALRKTLLKGPDAGHLFLTQYGKPWKRSSVYALFNRLNDERGPDARHLRPHLLRSTIAIHLLRGGADIRYIQEFLGHSCLETTMIYLQIVPGHLADDYNAAMLEVDLEA